MKKPIIAIDGYSSTGKSSISKALAEKFGFIHIDTGALYRAITLYAIENCMENGSINFELLKSKLPEIHLEFRNGGADLTLYLNGTDISADIRSNEVADHVSYVARRNEIRNFLLSIQRNMAKNGGVVMDGRDIGTVILPDADYKFFLTASLEERCKRRYNELKAMGIEADWETVKENLMSRDKIDSERDTAPLKKAEDAILVDNSELSKEQTIELLASYLSF